MGDTKKNADRAVDDLGDMQMNVFARNRVGREQTAAAERSELGGRLTDLQKRIKDDKNLDEITRSELLTSLNESSSYYGKSIGSFAKDEFGKVRSEGTQIEADNYHRALGLTDELEKTYNLALSGKDPKFLGRKRVEEQSKLSVDRPGRTQTLLGGFAASLDAGKSSAAATYLTGKK